MDLLGQWQVDHRGDRLRRRADTEWISTKYHEGVGHSARSDLHGASNREADGGRGCEDR